jgi:hypothetical protein
MVLLLDKDSIINSFNSDFVVEIVMKGKKTIKTDV